MDGTVAIYMKLQPGVETIRIERQESNKLELEEANTIEQRDTFGRPT